MTARDIYSQVTTLLMGDTVQMVVKKATTRVKEGPKRKYINVLVNYGNRADSDVSHLLQCVLHRMKKRHRIIAYKSLVVLNYILVSCKRNDFYRLLSSLPSIVEGNPFFDTTPEGIEMNKRFVNYVEFINQKVKFFRDLGYNLDSGPKKDLQDIIENSPENILGEVNNALSCLDILSKQDLEFNPLMEKPVLLGNIVLVKDLVRIHACLKKRTKQIEENREVFPEDALKNLHFYYSKIESLENQIKSIYTIAQELNIQSVVRLIDTARSRSNFDTIATDYEKKNTKINPQNPEPSWEDEGNYPSEIIYQGKNNQSKSYESVEPEVSKKDEMDKKIPKQEEQRASLSLIDFDDSYLKNDSENNLNLTNDMFNISSLFQNPSQGHSGVLGEQYPFSRPPSYHPGNFQGSQPNIFEQKQFSSQIGTEQLKGSMFNEEPPNPSQAQNSFDIDFMMKKNLDFNMNSNNIFAQQPPPVNVTPARGMTVLYNPYANPIPQNVPMQYTGYNIDPRLQYNQNQQNQQTRNVNNPFF